MFGLASAGQGALDWRPPVQRGDLHLLAGGASPGCVAIVDGYFHDRLAVGHWELRDLLAQGWIVWGLSSMGALRAVEMNHMGMKGFGRVFDYYRARPETPDDEVALLHGPAPEYAPISEPLLHLREALDCLRREDFIRSGTHDVILAELEGCWFGDRRVTWVLQRVAALESPVLAVRSRERLGDFSEFCIKTHDLTAFLEMRPWEH